MRPSDTGDIYDVTGSALKYPPCKDGILHNGSDDEFNYNSTFIEPVTNSDNLLVYDEDLGGDTYNGIYIRDIDRNDHPSWYKSNNPTMILGWKTGAGQDWNWTISTLGGYGRYTRSGDTVLPNDLGTIPQGVESKTLDCSHPAFVKSNLDMPLFVLIQR